MPFPPPGDLPDPRIEPSSPASQADSLPTELQRKSFCELVANFYSHKAKKIPASRLALGDWLGYYRVTIGMGSFAYFGARKPAGDDQGGLWQCLQGAQSGLEVTLVSWLCLSGLGERPHTCGLGPGLHRLVS